jgi:regulator of RNase E activity RraA
MTIVNHGADVPPLDQAARERLQALDTTLISDVMAGRGTMAAAIGPAKSGTKMVGPARTSYSPGAVEAAIHAIAACQPGEVIVIAGGGGDAHASLGGIMAMDAERHGAAGCLIDGAIRDTAEIRDSGFPIYARASTPHGAGVDPDGTINGPVDVAGVRVNPGDVVVGDDDGVVVIPRADLDQVIADAEAKGEKEAGWVAGLKAGQSLAEIHNFTPPLAAR